jgi:hypothetical protein
MSFYSLSGGCVTAIKLNLLLPLEWGIRSFPCWSSHRYTKIVGYAARTKAVPWRFGWHINIAGLPWYAQRTLRESPNARGLKKPNFNVWEHYT